MVPTLTLSSFIILNNPTLNEKSPVRFSESFHLTHCVQHWLRPLTFTNPNPNPNPNPNDAALHRSLPFNNPNPNWSSRGRWTRVRGAGVHGIGPRDNARRCCCHK